MWWPLSKYDWNIINYCLSWSALSCYKYLLLQNKWHYNITLSFGRPFHNCKKPGMPAWLDNGVYWIHLSRCVDVQVYMHQYWKATVVEGKVQHRSVDLLRDHHVIVNDMNQLLDKIFRNPLQPIIQLGGIYKIFCTEEIDWTCVISIFILVVTQLHTW